MKKTVKIAGILAIYISIISCSTQQEQQQQNAQQDESTIEKRSLVWADEFEVAGAPDTSRWGYDLGDGCPDVCGWGNNELQYYTNRPENVRVEDGKLLIEAHRESFEGKEYTSTRLVSKNKGHWQYGYIEARAKLPQGTGTWPAIWMLPTDWVYGGWPASGEIDIMEHVGFNQNMVYGTVHTKAFNHNIGTHKGDSLALEDVHNSFHLYAIDWSPDKIDFLIDGELYNTFENEGTGYEAWPFDKPFHLLINLAVGGDWGGTKGVDENLWPQRLEVDYIRVYE